MEWLSSALALIAIVLLLCQGYSFLTHLRSMPHTRLAGALTILGATIGLIGLCLFAFGALVFSPEYGVFLVEGRNAAVWFCVLLVGACLAAGLGLHAARCGKQCPDRFRWILGTAILVGISAASRVGRLNHGSDPAAVHVRYYDLWWPVFLIWMVACFSEWIATAMNLRARVARGAVAIFMITGIALEAVRREHRQLVYADGTYAWVWEAVVLLGVPAVMVLGTRLSIMKFEDPAKPYPRHMCIGFEVLTGFVGLSGTLVWLAERRVSWFFNPLLLWAAWVVVLGGLTAVRLYRSWRAGTLKLPDIGRPGRADDIVVVLALVVVAASLVDIFYLTKLDPTWDFAGLILAWMVLLEVMVGSPLRAFATDDLKHVLSTEARVSKIVTTASAVTRQVLSATAASIKSYFTAESKATAILKIAVGLVVLIAVAEIPNAGKIIVLPFDTGALSGDNKDLGHVLSNLVVNKLGIIGQELRPDLFVVLGDAREDKTRIAAAVGEEGGELQASVKSSDIEIPGTRYVVPMSILTAPIQGPMRRLLGVRVIRGSIQQEGSMYVLLAYSSSGETWRLEYQPKAASGEQAKGGVNDKGETSPSSPTKDAEASLDPLADQLAYSIITSDPGLARAGMTSSSRALLPFCEGLKKWKQFEGEENFEALTDAIEQFREAVRADHDFALAYYRLGQALRSDGQPEAASEAFRGSLEANPGFIAGQLALAETLYDFDAYYYSPPAASWARMQRPGDLEAKKLQARRTWQRVLGSSNDAASVSDRAAAYTGLCSSRYAPGFVSDAGPELALQYLAYFYCKRADRLYAKLPPPARASAPIKAAHGLVLNEIGVILDASGHADRQTADENNSRTSGDSWRCDMSARNITAEGEFSAAGLAPHAYVRPALNYYHQALALRPEDATIRCNAALASWRLGDRKPMQDLDNFDKAHQAVANALFETARRETDEKRSATLYRRSLAEFQRAVTLAPSNVEALNGYAYAFWVWSLHQSNSASGDRPGPVVAQRAEWYARLAKRLAFGRGSPVVQAQVQSTLGEVLLAQARPHEAYQLLEQVQVMKHPAFDEIRWDLAQAYLCASYNDSQAVPRESEPEDLAAKAAAILAGIRTNEQSREDQPFSRANWLDAARAPRVCMWPSEIAGEQQPDRAPHFRLAGAAPTYTSYRPCNWLGVMADADDGGKPLAGVLHVWGGGVDRRITLGPQRRYVVLTSEPRDTHQYYFAQLENEVEEKTGSAWFAGNYRALSPVYPLKTFANGTSGQCTKNLIYLKFVPAS